MKQNKSQEKRNVLRTFWPDVKTEKGAREATASGAVALGYIVFSYVVVTVMMISTGKGVFVPIADEFQFATTLAVSILFIVLAVILMWLLLKRQNLIAAGIGVVWCVAEAVMKIETRPEAVVVVSFLMVLFSINGVRGALAARQMKQATV